MCRGRSDCTLNRFVRHVSDIRFDGGSSVANRTTCNDASRRSPVPVEEPEPVVERTCPEYANAIFAEVDTLLRPQH